MTPSHERFRLVTSVKRGSVPNAPEAWAVYPTLEAARAGAARLLQHERVVRVMVVHDEPPRSLVEWLA
jgi:hypothetical protein